MQYAMPSLAPPLLPSAALFRACALIFALVPCR